ncbi:MAG: hypothetical protein KME57_27585 [Scytonema hyalinum WJT4-NPBG1]|jgi:hypothetical protein|nr:hypothetical protein [Scytonema hyalinum WJT4-NPBG1]
MHSAIAIMRALRAIAIMRVLRAIARVDVDTWRTKDYTIIPDEYLANLSHEKHIERVESR